MVSFSCENCGDILTKKKLDPHRNQCRGAYFTCIDCMTTFNGYEFRSHTSCMSEEQKYQGSLYKNKNKKQRFNDSKDVATPSRNPPNNNDNMTAVMSNYHIPFPPRAPSPPLARDTAAAGPDVNVFDYYVGEATPTASTIGKSSELVRFQGPDDDDDDDDDNSATVMGDAPAVVPAATPAYDTPAPRQNKHQHKESNSSKTDKKRKRLHVDTSRERTSVDRPSMHTGLTGTLKNMMPPSPAESGDSAHSPSSPIKKSKVKENAGIMSIFGAKPKKEKSGSKSKSSSPKDTKKSSSRTRRHQKTAAKLLEYKNEKKEAADVEGGSTGQMVLFDASKAQEFLSLVTESDHGYSLNKALKRYRKQTHADKSEDTNKELFKLLRVRRNDRGEIVLFCEEPEEREE